MGFYDPGETFDTQYGDIPEGEYPAVLNQWNWKATKATDPIPGSQEGITRARIHHRRAFLMNRKHWERLNLDNPNEKAVGIAKETEQIPESRAIHRQHCKRRRASKQWVTSKARR